MTLYGELKLEAANQRIAEGHRQAGQERLARMSVAGETLPQEHGLVERLRDAVARRFAAFRPVETARS